jgi:biotin transport system permease protein
MAEALIFHYRQQDRFLNRCNPATKFASVIAICFPLMQASFAASLLLLCPLVALATVQRLPLASYGRELRFFLFMAVLIGTTSLFSDPDPLAAVGSCLRFLAIVLAGMLLADSTAPDDLARSIGSLLEKVPLIGGWTIASRIELTLAIVPIIFDVSEQVSSARKARAGREGHPIKAIAAFGESIFTLLLDRSEDLSAALDARLYDPARPRQTLGYGKPDLLLGLATVLLVCAGYMLY